MCQNEEMLGMKKWDDKKIFASSNAQKWERTKKNYAKRMKKCPRKAFDHDAK